MRQHSWEVAVQTDGTVAQARLLPAFRSTVDIRKPIHNFLTFRERFKKEVEFHLSAVWL